MKTNEVVFILDRSGSMRGLEQDTIGGFNSVIKEQKEQKEDGEVLVSTILFDNERKVLHDRVEISNIKDMTDKDYIPWGNTALIDAIGYSIKHIKNIYKYIREEDKPEHTLFVIITDGLENSSIDYSSDEVKKMIEEQKKNENWEFMFIGANIDSVETAKHFGIERDYSYNYLADSEGIDVVYKSLSSKIGATRKCCKKAISSNKCMKAVSKDYIKRKKK